MKIQKYYDKLSSRITGVQWFPIDRLWSASLFYHSKPSTEQFLAILDKARQSWEDMKNKKKKKTREVQEKNSKSDQWGTGRLLDLKGPSDLI